MKDRLIHIYDWLQTHRRWLWIGVIAVLVPLIGLAVSLRYNEDIMDFLPATAEEREAFQRLQAQESASRLVLIIEGDSLREEALDECAELIPDLQTDALDQMEQLYAQLPYLIADSVYDRFDSLFTPEAIHKALERDKAILATPGASVLATAIQSDPLGLISLSAFSDQLSAHRTYAFYETPHGSTETKHNAALVDSLNAVAQQVSEHYPNLSIRWIGAPVISVGNARRIKTDTLVCIALSLVLIIALLAYAFPRKRDLWLILLAVNFGWLFGMAVLRIFTPTVSAVVLGIGSVLIGIAVNYPLHLLVHQRYTTSVRQTLDEVLSPLVVGNITTVGAFMALIPLQSTALRHLGIFASAMLIGTILFCIFVLPHLMSAEPTPVREIKVKGDRIASGGGKMIGEWVIVGITVLFGVYLAYNSVSGHHSPLFDSNLSHINYMTEQQRTDIQAFAMKKTDAGRWTEYWATHDRQAVIAIIETEAQEVGFRPEAFTPFYDTLTDWQPLPDFEISDLAKRLSDDFDYIGLCCSLIVFIFLWISFRDIWLALMAFVPMALSWVWILALMQLIGLQFNIVNIILATFIFGQGDDYTIFIVEGLLYEYRTGKPILPQYRQSILLSALIMLIGIGILVFAVHPAMHSLGTVTLIGMSIVLLMATTIPPLLFRLYTRFQLRKGGDNGKR